MIESNQYVVYPDKMRSGISAVVYAAFIILEGYILFTNGLGTLWNILLVVLMLFFLWQVIVNLRAMGKSRPLLVISDEGIKDYTSAVDFGLIPWSAIQKIETYPGGTSLQIGILVHSHYTFNNGASKNAGIIAQRNIQRTGNSLSIDGFTLGNKRLKEIFNTLQEYGKKNNPSIIFREYEDPLLKRKKKKQNA